jgi:TorA maturation chaperone TorD
VSKEPTAVASDTVEINEEESLRAQCYRLLAGLLMAPREPEALERLSGLKGDESALGQALTALGRAAGATGASAADDEYHDLFIGVGRGELVPYGSYYLTGFLYEKPLARLRQDMARLGIGRADEVKEPEDHIASLCETMAGLITGAFGAPADLEVQRKFFDAHIGPWAGKFFSDLEAAKTASFYMPVGAVGRLFMEIESTAFEMAA